jgi:peptidoglycan biosynthesis protein MviN/MurJ (putative lipid II flippase)
MAYAAVLIEGLAGELFFFRRKQIKTSAFLLTMFCLLYSAFQHLLILTIVFGKDFWMALDVFLNGITKTFIRQQQHYSLYLVLFYIACYFLAGIFGGILNCRIIAIVQSGMEPKVVSRLKTQYPEGINNYNPVENKKSTARHTLRYVLAAILFIILLLSYSSIFDNTIVKTKAGQIILRGILIVIVWWFLISPLLVRVIKNWVIKYKKGKGAFVQEILSLFPDIRKIVLISWKMSSKTNRFKRVPEFIENTMLLTVYGK